ncbi:uncharacterized protein LOC131675864 [Topomyia yanbarensis]|uniref:uncharacterized protein LOC131675864 n=1 Tax=Topomyia yanbarensis TaxID=2498891 RepID=UPI00273B7C8F|nr:uncharacterized protein LOC131675864 [Topomyia yanbarensis]
MASSSGGPPAPLSRRLPEYMDQQNEFGALTILMMEGTGDAVLPKNPFVVGKSVEDAAGPIESASSEAKGTRYTLRVRKPEQVTKLLNMTKLIDNTPVSVIPHPILNSTRCVVSSVDLIEVEDKQILDHLSSQGVTAIRRIKRKIDGTEVNTPTIILTFGKTTYPQSVKVGILSVRTPPYYPNPMLCYGCFQYGHTKARCPGPARCGKCSSDNHAEICENAEYCNNCKGDHRPSDRRCPMYKEETEVIKVKIDHNLPFLEARKRVSAGNKSYASTAAQPVQPSCEQNKIDAIFKMMTKKDEQMDKLIQAINEKDKEL